eukprot:15452155-Alexandrium_andersonii.AAC.1
MARRPGGGACGRAEGVRGVPRSGVWKSLPGARPLQSRPSAPSERRRVERVRSRGGWGDW